MQVFDVRCTCALSKGACKEMQVFSSPQLIWFLLFFVFSLSIHKLSDTTFNTQKRDKGSLVRITQTPSSVLWAPSLRLGPDRFNLLSGVREFMCKIPFPKLTGISGPSFLTSQNDNRMQYGFLFIVTVISHLQMQLDSRQGIFMCVIGVAGFFKRKMPLES